ncbi:hypothetical protein BpHYR1_038976 [Brachionus plicatilis]|uniref:Uncharacterized protein n=1 Tax=Brachionus plicatilis TaxID=10195 RepID=A0A3M7SGV7_BRAPC|nr:hypothetical protein BpHYR1_038976 [Brachionus plicatilis]
MSIKCCFLSRPMTASKLGSSKLIEITFKKSKNFHNGKFDHRTELVHARFLQQLLNHSVSSTSQICEHSPSHIIAQLQVVNSAVRIGLSAQTTVQIDQQLVSIHGHAFVHTQSACVIAQKLRRIHLLQHVLERRHIISQRFVEQINVGVGERIFFASLYDVMKINVRYVKMQQTLFQIGQQSVTVLVVFDYFFDYGRRYVAQLVA